MLCGQKSRTVGCSRSRSDPCSSAERNVSKFSSIREWNQWSWKRFRCRAGAPMAEEKFTRVAVLFSAQGSSIGARFTQADSPLRQLARCMSARSDLSAASYTGTCIMKKGETRRRKNSSTISCSVCDAKYSLVVVIRHRKNQPVGRAGVHP